MSEQFVEAFQHEVAEEKAEALGRTGKRLEHALEQLRAHDQAHRDSRAAPQGEPLLWISPSASKRSPCNARRSVSGTRAMCSSSTAL